MLTIAVLGTFDTKGPEHAFVADCIRQAGFRALLIDVGTAGPPTIAPHLTREAVREAAAQTTVPRENSPGSEPTASSDRGEAIAAMARAAPHLLRQLVEQGEIHGIISLGGSGGTCIATAAMRALPLGLPKVMVSTVAGGDVRPYVDISDIVMIPSIVDVSGLNRVARGVFARAAAVVTAMAAAQTSMGSQTPVATLPAIAASMFGNTTQCVQYAMELLEDAGYETIVFHATGRGGRTMESLIAEGMVAGVLDVTTTEWADELVGGVMAGGPHRLEAAARAGIPAVVAPGCLDMVNFGPRDSVPAQFANRKFYQHNPQITLMRTTADECAQLGQIIADKLNQSTGQVHVLFPRRAISVISAAGQPFHDPAADAALLTSLQQGLRPDIPLEVVDCEINDPLFAERCVERLVSSLRGGHTAP